MQHFDTAKARILPGGHDAYVDNDKDRDTGACTVKPTAKLL